MPKASKASNLRCVNLTRRFLFVKKTTVGGWPGSRNGSARWFCWCWWCRGARGGGSMNPWEVFHDDRMYQNFLLFSARWHWLGTIDYTCMMYYIYSCDVCDMMICVNILIYDIYIYHIIYTLLHISLWLGVLFQRCDCNPYEDLLLAPHCFVSFFINKFSIMLCFFKQIWISCCNSFKMLSIEYDILATCLFQTPCATKSASGGGAYLKGDFFGRGLSMVACGSLIPKVGQRKTEKTWQLLHKIMLE